MENGLDIRLNPDDTYTARVGAEEKTFLNFSEAVAWSIEKCYGEDACKD